MFFLQCDVARFGEDRVLELFLHSTILTNTITDWAVGNFNIPVMDALLSFGLQGCDTALLCVDRLRRSDPLQDRSPTHVDTTAMRVL